MIAIRDELIRGDRQRLTNGGPLMPLSGPLPRPPSSSVWRAKLRGIVGETPSSLRRDLIPLISDNGNGYEPNENSRFPGKQKMCTLKFGKRCFHHLFGSILNSA